MPADPVICPACDSRLKRPASLRDGDLFECPMCAEEFPVGGVEGKAAQRRPPHHDVDEEIGEELEIISGNDEGGRGRSKLRKKRSRKGVAELGRWISLGFTHWLPMLLPSVGFCILYVLGLFLISLPLSLLSLIPVAGGVVSLITIVSLGVSWSAGVTLVSLQQLQGKRWSFGVFFGGSQWWLSLLLNWVLLEILYGIVLFVPALLIAEGLRALAVSPLIIPWATGSYMLLAFVCLYPLTLMFSWQLILDGNYGPLEAITENVRMALPNFFRLLPLAILTLLLRCVGYMFFFVGFAATWPLAVLIETAAYLRLTGRRVAESSSEVN